MSLVYRSVFQNYFLETKLWQLCPRLLLLLLLLLLNAALPPFSLPPACVRFVSTDCRHCASKCWLEGKDLRGNVGGGGCGQITLHRHKGRPRFRREEKSHFRRAFGRMYKEKFS